MQSIRRRLTLVLVLFGCSLWALGSGAAYLAMRAGLIAEFDRAHLTDLSALFNMTEQSEAGLKFDSTGEYMPNFQRADHPDYFQLWESNGETLYRSPTLLGQPDLPRRIGTPEDPSDWNLILPDGLPGRAAGVRFVPKEDDETPRPPGAPSLTREVILVAAFHRQALDERLRLLGTVLLATGVAMAASTAAAVGFVVRHGLRPLASLGERAGAIDADSLKREREEGIGHLGNEVGRIYNRIVGTFAQFRANDLPGVELFRAGLPRFGEGGRGILLALLLFRRVGKVDALGKRDEVIAVGGVLAGSPQIPGGFAAGRAAKGCSAACEEDEEEPGRQRRNASASSPND